MKWHGSIRTAGSRHQLRNAFQGDFELKFHLAPPI